MCEESASFDWTSADIASAIRDVKELSDKMSDLVAAEESGAADMDTDLAGGMVFENMVSLVAADKSWTADSHCCG